MSTIRGLIILMNMLIEEGILKFEQQEENSVGIHSDTRRCVPTTNLAFDNHIIILLHQPTTIFHFFFIDRSSSGYTSLGITL